MASAGSSFDELKVRNEICGGSPELISMILSNFLEHGPQQSCDIRKAFDAGDIAETRRLCHSLKGMASYVCASKLESLALAAQMAYDNNLLDNIQDQIAAIEAEVPVVVRDVRNALARK